MEQLNSQKTHPQNKYFYESHIRVIFRSVLFKSVIFNLAIIFYYLLHSLLKIESALFAMATSGLFSIWFFNHYGTIKHKIIYGYGSIFSKGWWKNFFKIEKTLLINYQISKQALLNIWLQHYMFYALFGTLTFSVNLILAFALESNWVFQLGAATFLLIFILYHCFKTPVICKLTDNELNPPLNKGTSGKKASVKSFSDLEIKKIQRAKLLLKWELDLNDVLKQETNLHAGARQTSKQDFTIKKSGFGAQFFDHQQMQKFLFSYVAKTLLIFGLFVFYFSVYLMVYLTHQQSNTKDQKTFFHMIFSWILFWVYTVFCFGHYVLVRKKVLKAKLTNESNQKAYFNKQTIVNIYLKYNVLSVIFGWLILSLNLFVAFYFTDSLAYRFLAPLWMVIFGFSHFFKTPQVCKVHHVIKQHSWYLRSYDSFAKTDVKKIQSAKRLLSQKVVLGLNPETN